MYLAKKNWNWSIIDSKKIWNYYNISFLYIMELVHTTPLIASGIAVNVHMSHSDGSMVTSVSWNHDDSATYYLHINSSIEKLLFQVEDYVSCLLVLYVWLEIG